MSLPEFEDPEWNRKRQEMQELLFSIVDDLLHHTQAAGCTFKSPSGLIIQISPTPKDTSDVRPH
jgi:hypothetical protein